MRVVACLKRFIVLAACLAVGTCASACAPAEDDEPSLAGQASEVTTDPRLAALKPFVGRWRVIEIKTRPKGAEHMDTFRPEDRVIEIVADVSADPPELGGAPDGLRLRGVAAEGDDPEHLWFPWIDEGHKCHGVKGASSDFFPNRQECGQTRLVSATEILASFTWRAFTLGGFIPAGLEHSLENSLKVLSNGDLREAQTSDGVVVFSQILRRAR